MASLQKAILTIANGATTSNALSHELRNCRSLAIIAPAVLTGTVTAESADLFPNEIVASTPGVENWSTIQSPPGTDVAIAADKVTVLTAAPFPQFRLASSLAEAATRTFVVLIQIGE